MLHMFVVVITGIVDRLLVHRVSECLRKSRRRVAVMLALNPHARRSARRSSLVLLPTNVLLGWSCTSAQAGPLDTTYGFSCNARFRQRVKASARAEMTVDAM